MKDYEIKKEQDLRAIVNILDAQKNKLYEIADNAKQAGQSTDQDECYQMISKIQTAMEAISSAALKAERKHEEDAANKLYNRMGI